MAIKSKNLKKKVTIQPPKKLKVNFLTFLNFFEIFTGKFLYSLNSYKKRKVEKKFKNVTREPEKRKRHF
ncbi:hypothetical protein MSIBF_A30002 [groundwater metagenome]|uniref:Uncharacterized protein n=1 Tax=groundwater metagenome TaxID=717931 RepID=A0A098ED51_9ZZZZ